MLDRIVDAVLSGIPGSFVEVIPRRDVSAAIHRCRVEAEAVGIRDRGVDDQHPDNVGAVVSGIEGDVGLPRYFSCHSVKRPSIGRIRRSVRHVGASVGAGLDINATSSVDIHRPVVGTIVEPRRTTVRTAVATTKGKRGTRQ
jgi:hypothetical protein